jgi:hypothetical protein
MGVDEGNWIGVGSSSKTLSGESPVLWAVGGTASACASEEVGAYLRKVISEGVRTTYFTVTEVVDGSCEEVVKTAVLMIESPCCAAPAKAGSESSRRMERV